MSTGVDRRRAVKARHREAILSAARGLVDEHGGPGFSVDELAERADVARRTVFNHFSSLDEVLIALCESDILVVVEQFRTAFTAAPAPEQGPGSVFDSIARAARATDIPPVIVAVVRTLGVPGTKGAKRGMLSREALDRATGDLIEEIDRRSPGANPLGSELLVQFLTTGLVVIGRHWFRRTGGTLDDEGRRVWNELMDELLASLRPVGGE